MLKSLAQFLARADELAARKDELTKRREEIRADKEKIFEDAGPEDGEAFAKVSALGSQEHLLTVQLAKLDREGKGLGATLLNESFHVVKAVRKALFAKRDKLLARLDADMAKHIPDEHSRQRILVQARMVAPEIRALERSAHIGGDGYIARGENAELRYAAGVFKQATRAIEEHGI